MRLLEEIAREFPLRCDSLALTWILFERHHAHERRPMLFCPWALLQPRLPCGSQLATAWVFNGHKNGIRCAINQRTLGRQLPHRNQHESQRSMLSLSSSAGY